MPKERVQKIMSNAGFCSRRKAEEFIDAGKVSVNGEKITLGDQADPDKDIIMVGKQRIQKQEHLYLMLHKPSGYITTRSDLWDRKNVMELLVGVQRAVYPIGRLDRDARGLLLLTSDGDFAQQIMHPSMRTTKTYQATLKTPLSKEQAASITNGVVVDSRRVRARIRKIKPKLVEITIHEGRNKIVKRIFKAVDSYVTDLKRVGVGNIRLDVPEGRFRELKPEEIEQLKEKQPRKKPVKKTVQKSDKKERKS